MFHKKISLFLAVCSIAVLSCNTNTSTPADNLIPKPVSVTKGSGQFTITEGTSIIAATEAVKIGAYLSAQLKPATGFALKVTPGTAATKGSIFLTLGGDASLGDEGYELSVTADQVTVTAQKPAGLFYGIQTIKQLLPEAINASAKQDAKWELQSVTIKDQPSYAYRGSMLDIARHFFGVEDIKRYIDLIATYKMNTLHLHLTDDQGWRIEIKSWPNLTAHGGSTEVGGKKGGFLTQDQYKDIVQYAMDRYITIIPEVDMPGHTNAALASYPELNCNDTATKLYTGTEVGFSTLCTSKEVVYKFLDDVIKELAAITPGQYIHIGGDESHATKKEDYIPFMEKVQGIVKAHGKLAIGWDEIANCTLQPNTIAQYWADAANSTEAVKKGAKVIISPARKAYADMQYDSTTRLGLHWAGYIEVDTAYIWDPATLEPGIKRENIVGVEAPLWTETIVTMDDIEYMLFPRLPGYAEIAWSPVTGRSWDEYKVRLGNHGPRMKAMGIDYYPSKKVTWK